MAQLIFLIAFISTEKRKFTQTLNVGINLPTTEDAYKGMTKCLLLCLDREYNSEHTLGARGFLVVILHASYVSYICTARTASGQERDSVDSAEPVTILLIRKHPKSGCFTDWLLTTS